MQREGDEFESGLKDVQAVVSGNVFSGVDLFGISTPGRTQYQSNVLARSPRLLGMFQSCLNYWTRQQGSDGFDKEMLFLIISGQMDARPL